MRRGLRLAAAILAAVFALAPAPVEAQEASGAGSVRIEKADFRDLPLADACRLLADQSDMNLVPSAEAGARKVTLYLRDVTAHAVVEALCVANELRSERDSATGIVRITTLQEYRTALTTTQEEKTEYFTLQHPNAMDVGYAIRNLFGPRVILRIGSGAQDDVDELEDRLERLDVLDSGATGLGSRLLGGQSGTGGTHGFGAASGSSLGTTRRERSRFRGSDDADGSADGGGTPRGESDVRWTEAVEPDRGVPPAGGDGEARAPDRPARMQQAAIHVTVARRQNKVIVRTGDPRALEQIRTLVERLDVPTPLVLLEVRVLSVELEDGQTSFFEYQWANEKIAGSFANGDIQGPPAGELGPRGTGLRPGDLTFQYVNDHFAARLQVLEIEGRVRTLSTPLLLTANNEASRLFVGREVPLNRSFSGGQVTTDDGVSTTTPGTTAIEFRPVGTTLLVTPNINSDRTVTLRIVQEASDVNSTAVVLVPSGTGFAQQVVSVVSSQSVSGTIVAKNEMAVAFGGLIEKSTVKDHEKVPVLGDLPLVGVPFRREIDRELRREIVVVVRPYVITTPAEAEAASRKLLGRLRADPESLDDESGAPAPAAPGEK